LGLESGYMLNKYVTVLSYMVITYKDLKHWGGVASFAVTQIR